jgi:hypothetical protein
MAIDDLDSESEPAILVPTLLQRASQCLPLLARHQTTRAVLKRITAQCSHISQQFFR